MREAVVFAGLPDPGQARENFKVNPIAMRRTWPCHRMDQKRRCESPRLDSLGHPRAVRRRTCRTCRCSHSAAGALRQTVRTVHRRRVREVPTEELRRLGARQGRRRPQEIGSLDGTSCRATHQRGLMIRSDISPATSDAERAGDAGSIPDENNVHCMSVAPRYCPLPCCDALALRNQSCDLTASIKRFTEWSAYSANRPSARFLQAPKSSTKLGSESPAGEVGGNSSPSR